jgi:UDP-N-acetylmuramate dehydrogenase
VVSRSATILADYTTLGVGGPAKTFVPAGTEAGLIEALREADAAGDPVLLIGGGSNLVIADEGFDGTVVHVNTRGIGFTPAGDGTVEVTVAAGEDWDGVVAATVAEGLAGLECLSGIPGRAGGTPVQNVGAYGHEVAEVITRVRVYDRQEAQLEIIQNESCQFSYRNSLFKSGRPEALVSQPGSASATRQSQPRYAVLDVTFLLDRQRRSTPVKYAELAAELGIELGERAGTGEVRAAVLKIRARKGMVLNPGDPDTRSVGSFFTNPVLTAAEFARVQRAAAAHRGRADPVPSYRAGPGYDDGFVKVPAAWLIEHAGFTKGYGAPGPARVSAKHTLALVNAGNASTADLLALAREIVAGVRAVYGVALTPEPVLVGVTL